jgi:hypothetical protein
VKKLQNQRTIRIENCFRSEMLHTTPPLLAQKIKPQAIRAMRAQRLSQKEICDRPESGSSSSSE